MTSVSIAEAKARLNDIVDRVAGGEAVDITRRGKSVALIVPTRLPRQPVDAQRLKALTERTPLQEEGAGAFMRRMRDDPRY